MRGSLRRTTVTMTWIVIRMRAISMITFAQRGNSPASMPMFWPSGSETSAAVSAMFQIQTSARLQFSLYMRTPQRRGTM